MSVVSIFSGIFCREARVVRQVAAKMACTVVSDADLVTLAANRSGIAESKVRRAFASKTSVFNKFTHEKEYAVAALKRAVAETLRQGTPIISGFCGLLVPASVSHVLKVCLIADLKFRLQTAKVDEGLGEKEAVRLLQREDAERAAWVEGLFAKTDPWDDSLYDIVIPLSSTDEAAAVDLIVANARKDVVAPTAASRRAVDDFYLATETEVAFLKAGHNVAVSAKDGHVTLTIDKPVLRLGRLEEELKAIAQTVDGVTGVDTVVGKGFHQADIYRRYDFDVPSRVLLVDDEREFVQTLSERLQLREMGSVVAYDGESAMALVQEDDPEVMIIDLKMPDIDGIEILKKVKRTRPEIEVIVLTGHGSEKDRQMCLKLGAFAYLQKPVDINLLSETLRAAHNRIRERQGASDNRTSE